MTVDAYTLAKRIPEDQPYTLRFNPTTGRRAGFAISMIAAIGVGVLCAFGAISDNDGGGARWFTLATASAFILMCLLLIVSVVRSATAGPTLALGPDGMWIKTRPGGRRQAIWLPWDSIALIALRATSSRLYLAVFPLDDNVTAGLGTLTRFGLAFQRLRISGWHHGGFIAQLTRMDHPEAETMQAVLTYNAGRAPLH